MNFGTTKSKDRPGFGRCPAQVVLPNVNRKTIDRAWVQMTWLGQEFAFTDTAMMLALRDSALDNKGHEAILGVA